MKKLLSFKRISLQEKVDFVKNLAVMLKSGITINEALTSIADQTKSRRFREIIFKIKKEVEMGVSLYEAFSKEKETFGDVFLSLLKTGESSGALEESLNFLASWLERESDLKKEIAAATLYPKIVLTATFFLGGALSVFILPKLVPLFEQLRVELPLTTRIMLSFALFLENFWFFVLGGIVGIFILFLLLNKIRKTRSVFHWLQLKIPFLGGLMVDYQLAIICWLFSILFKSGISISESLKIVSESATNIHYQQSLKKIRQRVSQGTTISESLKDFAFLYPKNLVNIIAVGEKSGTLERSFNNLSEFYSKEVQNKTKKLPMIIEPLLLIFIGICVGFLALSVIMPIYQLTGGLSQ